MSVPPSNLQAYGWIRPAVNQSMFQAIDSIAEMGDSGDREHMVLVARNLHQIQGSLQMVELDAASTFARDLELLTDKLAEDSDMPDQASAIRVLKSGLEALRRYLKTIEAQSPQSPLFLMDQMNAVREVTGQEQVSRFDLFDPPLEAAYPHSDGTVAFQDSQMGNVMSHLRKRYRKSLLEWMNGRSPAQALEIMRNMMAYLQKIAGPGVLQQLWWIAAGFIEVIKNKGIELTPEVYARLAELDIQMGRMRTQRMADIASTPPNELIRWMLYSVGQAKPAELAESNGASSTAREIKEMFGLDQWFFMDHDSFVVDEFWDLVNAMEALSHIISESDIQYLEEAVDRYFSGGQDEEEKLELFSDLKKLRKTIHKHDVGVVRDFIDILCDTIMDVDINPDVMAVSGADIKIASAILLLGDTLKKPSIISAEWKDSIQQRIEELDRVIQQNFSASDSARENQQQAKLELVSATVSLVQEARRHLSGVEEILAGAEAMDAKNLSRMRDLLQQVARLLWFINAPDTGELVNRVDTVLARYFESGQDVSEATRETLAYVVASIEIIVETIGGGNPEPEEIIEQAQNHLDTLGVSDSVSVDEEESSAEDESRIDFEDAVAEGGLESEDQMSEQASDSVVESDDPLDMAAKEILDLVGPIADTPDEILAGDGVEETVSQEDAASDPGEAEPQSTEHGDHPEDDAVAQDAAPLEATDVSEPIEAGADVDADIAGQESIGHDEERLFSILEQIDSLRRSIDPDNRLAIEELSGHFTSLMTDQSPAVRDEFRQVAAIGDSVVKGLIQREIRCNDAINDFLGLLTRQMTSMVTENEEVEIQLSAWISKANSLLNDAALASLPADRPDEEKSEILSDGPDAGLLDTFAGELQDHADGLGQAAEKLLSVADDPRNEDIDLDAECERVSRIVHTMAGNFGTLGYSEYGDCIHELEDVFLASEGRADLMQEYALHLGQLSTLVRTMSGSIKTERQIPSELGEALTSISDVITAVYREHMTPVVTEEVPATPPGEDDGLSGVSEQVAGSDEIVSVQGEDDGPVAEESASSLETQDDEFEQELKAVFLEESEVILGRINGLLSQWKAEGFNQEILAGVLREFHTLKGSAATTGFDDISSLCHSVESLLERTVVQGVDSNDDHTVDLLEEMHDGIGSDLGLIPGGEPGQVVSLQGVLDKILSGTGSLAQATDDSVSDETAGEEIADSEVAEDTSAPELAEETIPETGPAVELVKEPEQTEEGITPAQDPEEAVDDISPVLGVEQAIDASPHASSEAAEPAGESDLPQETHEEDFEDELKKVFLEESEVGLGRINGLLTQWKSGGLSQETLAGILRELHTLKGSAAATGFDDISNLCHSVESLLERTVSQDVDSNDDFTLNLLEEMHDGIGSDLGLIPGGEPGQIGSLQGVLDRVLSGADSLAQATEEKEIAPDEMVEDEAADPEVAEDTSAPELAEETIPVIETVPVAEPEKEPEHKGEDVASVEDLVEAVDEIASVLDIEQVTDDSPYAPAEATEPAIEEGVRPQEAPDEDFEQELEAIFLEESEVVLGRINGLLSQWKAEGFNQEILAGVLREFHTLKGSAATTGFDDISGLCHSVESLLERTVVQGVDSNDDHTVDLLEEMHDGIGSDLGLIPGGEPGQIGSLQGVLDRVLSGAGYLDQVTDEIVPDETAQKDAVESEGVEDMPAPQLADESAPETETVSTAEPVKELDQTGEEAASVEDQEKTVDDIASDLDVGQVVDDSSLAPTEADEPTVGESVLAQGTQDEDSDQEPEAIFREESEMILGRINGLLTQWKAEGLNREILAGVLGEFRTLKGSAAATGQEEISSLSHSIESLLEGEIVLGTDSDNDAILNLLEEMHDGVASELGLIPGGEAGHIVSLKGIVDTLLSREPDPVQASDEEFPGKEERVILAHEQPTETEDDARTDPVEDADEPVSESVPTGDVLESQQSDQLLPASVESTDDQSEFSSNEEALIPDAELPFWMKQAIGGHEAGSDADDDVSATGSMRIENRKLADLLNFSGEMGLTRTQLRNTIESTREELVRMRGSMGKIREGLRDLEFEADAQMRSMPERQQAEMDEEEFDPLQLDRYSRLQARAREVSQYLDELGRVERQLEERTAEISGTLVQQSHVGEQLQDQLLDTRLVNVGEYFPRFRTLIRDFSRRMEKRVSFSASGGDVNVDRQVMDLMIAPFEHMIRNAISHGVESPDMRRQLGKPEVGSIRIAIVQQGSELVIDFSDDGYGLDKEKLHQRAVQSGSITPDTPMTDDLMLRVITEHGFSTAEHVTMGAGRGVGMDVVIQMVRLLGGAISVTSESGEGTTFHFRVPVTMTISQALLVRAGSYRFAVLTRTMERVMRVRASEFEVIEDQRYVKSGEQMIPIIDLVEMIGETSLSTEEDYRSIILARVGERLAGIQIDQFEETIDIVSKTPGRQLTSIPGINGVTVLVDTTIVLILNLEELVGREATVQLPKRQIVLEAQASDDLRVEDAPEMPALSEETGSVERILVVDDSLVVRRVMVRDLEGIGMSPIAAVDGLDALDQLEGNEVDFALIDLEMPRMNGYELLISLRQDERFTRLPVIVITSRSSDTHRERAMRLGADGYVTKPYDINQLEQLMLSIAATKHSVH